MTRNSINENLKQVERALHTVAEQAKKLEEQIVRARGTKDITAQARAATRAAEPEDMTSRIRALLFERGPMSLTNLASTLGEPAARVQRTVRTLRDDDKIRNAGEPEDPRWWWAQHDDGPTAELKLAVEKLIRHRPMLTQEIMMITGARRNRINGVLVKLQVAGLPVKDLSKDPRRSLWRIEPNGHRAPASRR